MGHSSLSPSAAGRWIACPGSIALSAKCPPQPASIHAAEGTVAHDLAYQLLVGKATHAALVNRIGETVMQDGFEIEITEDMVDGAKMYHDSVWGHITEIRQSRGGVKQAPVHMKAEERVCASSVSPDLWGTSDCTFWQNGNVLEVVDYKYGKGVPVEATGNKQMLIYAIAAMDSAAKSWAFDKVRLTVVQPRAPHAEGPVRTWEISVAELKKYAAEIKKAVVATAEPNPKTVAGAHCRWCPAKGICPAMLGAAQKAVAADFDTIPSPGRVLDASSLTMEQALNALAWEDTVGEFFKALRSRLEAELQMGRAVPGWKLVEGKSNRQWTEETQVVKELGPLLGDAIYVERKVKSPAQIEKLVGKGKVDHLTMKPAGKIVMVEESDPRPAVETAGVAGDFEALLSAPVRAESPKTVVAADDLNGLL